MVDYVSYAVFYIPRDYFATADLHFSIPSPRRGFLVLALLRLEVLHFFLVHFNFPASFTCFSTRIPYNPLGSVHLAEEATAQRENFGDLLIVTRPLGGRAKTQIRVFYPEFICSFSERVSSTECHVTGWAGSIRPGSCPHLLAVVLKPVSSATPLSDPTVTILRPGFHRLHLAATLWVKHPGSGTLPRLRLLREAASLGKGTPDLRGNVFCPGGGQF